MAHTPNLESQGLKKQNQNKTINLKFEWKLVYINWYTNKGTCTFTESLVILPCRGWMEAQEWESGAVQPQSLKPIFLDLQGLRNKDFLSKLPISPSCHSILFCRQRKGKNLVRKPLYRELVPRLVEKKIWMHLAQETMIMEMNLMTLCENDLANHVHRHWRIWNSHGRT